MRTKDFVTAKQALDDWFVLNAKPFMQDDLLLAQCLVRYYEDHAQGLRRAGSERLNLKYWLDFFSESQVSDVRATEQRKFIRHLHSKGMARTTIEGIFKTGKSAIEFCWKEEMIKNKQPFIDAGKELKKLTFEKKTRWRAIEPLEMIKMIEHANDERLIRYIMLLIAGTSRSTAGIEISGKNIDLNAGTITLLQDGNEQTNKYRATVKLPDFIRAIYCDGNLCSQDEITPNLNNLRNRKWIPTRKAARLESSIVPYSIRHGMAKWLRGCGVDPWHVSAQLGHKRGGSEVTEIYASFDPSYLSESLEAIEAYFAIIYTKSKRLQEFLSGTGYEPRCDLVAKYGSVLAIKDVSV